MKTLIVSGGQVDDIFAFDWIKKEGYSYMIAADKGLEFFFRNDMWPDLIVGDYDSVDTESLEYFKSKSVKIITLNPMKDDTDTEFAIRKAIAEGATSITLLGATGTRLDHVFGNVELLGIGLQEAVLIELVDAHNRIRMIDTTLDLRKDTQFGKYVSLIPFSKEIKGVTLEGFKYPLKEATLERFCTLGISNEIVDENATIRIGEGIALVIESRD